MDDLVIISKMMENTSWIGTDQLREIYGPLCRWTSWWFAERDANGNGLPEYHHGNDSGWDNSTVFLANPPVESPDLAAFLVIQMEVLALIAEKLGYSSESQEWMAKAQILLARLQTQLLTGTRPLARNCQGTAVNSDSLLLYVPIILGKRLPENVQQALVRGLADGAGFLTDYGLATESIHSSYYQSDGYWRGPIWAPSTMLIVDGLASLGEQELVHKICSRFTKMAVKSGFAENYDALTGDGLRDRAYTWTSSVWLVLAHEYLGDND